METYETWYLRSDLHKTSEDHRVLICWLKVGTCRVLPSMLIVAETLYDARRWKLEDFSLMWVTPRDRPHRRTKDTSSQLREVLNNHADLLKLDTSRKLRLLWKLLTSYAVEHRVNEMYETILWASTICESSQEATLSRILRSIKIRVVHHMV